MTEHAPQPAPPRRPNQWLFWGILLAPAVLTLLVVGSERPSGEASLRAVVTMGIPASIVAGVVCGVMNASCGATHSGHRVVLGLVSTVFYMMMSLAMCVIGCSAAGGN